MDVFFEDQDLLEICNTILDKFRAGTKKNLIHFTKNKVFY